MKKVTRENSQQEMRRLLLNSGVPLVFASLGDEENGASLEEIKMRCKLDSPSIEKAIQELVRLDAVTHRGGRYYPCAPHIAIDRLGGDEFFKIDFERSISILKKNFESNPRHEQSLYLSSTFSIHEKHLAKLKQTLNQVLTEFITQSEEANGDGLVNFVVGLTPN